MNKKQEKFCEEFYDETQIDIAYAVLNDKKENIDDMMEYLEERCSEIEVIYFSNAMEYLKEHDRSLQESLALAADCGFSVENLNSETLATLLMQQKARERVWELRDEIEELFFS